MEVIMNIHTKHNKKLTMIITFKKNEGNEVTDI